MAYNADEVIRIAKGEVRTTEGPKNDNKYGRELGQNHILWCSLFVSWVMKKAGFGSLYPVTAGTRVSYPNYKAKKWLLPKAEARAGDIVWMFFSGREGPVNHIGFVTRNLGNGLLATIEGNSNGPTGDGVWPHQQRKAIVAVGRPGGPGAIDVAAPVPFPGKVIKRGSTGPNVKAVQHHLNRFLPHDIPETGTFDAATERELTKWQRNRLVPADSIGVVGPGTWAMLAAPRFTETLREGSKGKAVQQLKEALNRLPGNHLDANNPNFGPDTKQAVKNWQDHRFQRVDGIVDMITWYWIHTPREIMPPTLHPR